MASKQDSNGVRTAQDLEKKYDFASLLGLKKNVEYAQKSILKINNELNNILNSLILNLKNVLDSQSEVSLWFYSGIPTTENEPYISWNSQEEHYGDIYYDQATGYVYQYSEEGWKRNKDTSLVQAMALTNSELVTNEHERKVFFDVPVTPYSSGDWWIKEEGILYICQLGKTAELTYDEADFVPSNQYSTTVALQQGEKLTVLQGTVQQITKDYVKFTDLATGGSTTIAGENIKTGVITSVNYASNSKGTKINLNNGTIDTKNFKLDEYGNVSLLNGSKIITDDGLMTNLQYLGNNMGYQGLMTLGLNVDLANNKFTKSDITIYADIPDNFKVAKAYITVIHQPVLWNSLYWGFTRNIGLYKAVFEGKFEGDWESDFQDKTEKLSQVTNIFDNNNSWQPSTPSSSNNKIEKKTTLDISHQISLGINKFVIQTTDTVPTFSSDYNTNQKNAMVNSGRVMAILNIYGFIKN
ncbi:MAG: hypothetical protein MSA89_09650 [Clostridium sp.]|nr:hypothetical protein [Clostridium sp.]